VWHDVRRRFALRIIYIGLLSAVGLLIAAVIGFLQDATLFGDDATYHVGEISSLATSFPFLNWDPRIFVGYVPTIGFSWLNYSVPALLVTAGVDAVDSFHLEFVASFLLLGFSILYFARSVGAQRILAFSMSILAWSTNAYWNLTVWGGAYDRAFTVPVLFVALGLTYRLASRLNLERSLGIEYWMAIAMWTLTYLGDIFVAIAGSLLGAIFLVLSSGIDRLTDGLRRAGMVFLPVFGLAAWQLVPIASQLFANGQYRHQILVPNNWSLLVLPAGEWVPSLNLVYLPVVFLIGTCCAIFRVRISTVQKALLASLTIMGIYWFVMGWVPPLWPLLPRLMATYSSVENIAWILLMAVPLFFGMLREKLATVEKPLFRINRAPRFSLSRGNFYRLLQVAVLLVIAVDAFTIIPSIRPANWQPLTDQLNSIMDRNIGNPTNDYRVSLENRLLTRGFLEYQPNRFETGGRTELLDPDPFYNSWYATDVFYKDDPSAIPMLYPDDQPPANVSSLTESTSNFAGSSFWLDWYAVNAVIFDEYASARTMNNYTSRPDLYNVTYASTTFSIPEVIAKPLAPSAILESTNATVVGFYSVSPTSQIEYDQLISILASLGLGPRFAIPLNLHSVHDASNAPIDVLVTDSNTYSLYSSDMQHLLKALSIVVVSSANGPLDSQPTTTQQGGRALVNIPLSFSQLVSSHEQGSYYFVKPSGIVPMNSFNATSAVYQGPTVTNVSSNSWIPSYNLNVQGTLQSQSNTLVLNLTSTNNTERSQYNIQSHLPSLIPLSSNLTISFLIEASANITLGVTLLSPRACCPNYVAVEQKIPAGTAVQLAIPFSMLNEWMNLTTMFGFTQDLLFAVNLAPGNPAVTLRISGVSISAPGYTIFTLPKAITPAESGILTHDSGASGIGLLNGSNASTTILTLSSNKPQSITTIASLSGGMAGEEYDKIITVGKSGQMPPMVTLFSQPSSSPVHEDWTNNQNMIATSIPPGYRGLVWKENYSNLWSFNSDQSSNGGPFAYYYAGPGMIYIPMSNYTSIRASFNSLTVESIGLYSAPFATIGALVILRNRLLTFRRKQTLKTS
jgi:hypothetical protein